MGRTKEERLRAENDRRLGDMLREAALVEQNGQLVEEQRRQEEWLQRERQRLEQQMELQHTFAAQHGGIGALRCLCVACPPRPCCC